MNALNRRSFLTLSGAALASVAAPAIVRADDGQRIVAAMEAQRDHTLSMRSSVKLTDYVNARVNEEMQLTVYSKPYPDLSRSRDLVHIDAPRRDAGKLMLRHGRDLYFYDPAAANTIRISPQQRLLGQASNGDVLSTNFSRDYRAQHMGRETIDDAARKPRACHHVNLVAHGSNAVYPRAEMWIDEASSRAVRGRFYAAGGRLMKIAFYDSYREVIPGSVWATRTLMVDGINNSRITVMEFSGFRPMEMPDHWFQQSFLPRFQKV